MKSFIEKYHEYMKTDSTLSSMRLAFFWVVRASISLAFLALILDFLAGLFSKQFNITAAAGIVGLMLATAFGGKTGQSFAEKETPQKPDTN